MKAQIGILLSTRPRQSVGEHITIKLAGFQVRSSHGVSQRQIVVRPVRWVFPSIRLL